MRERARVRVFQCACSLTCAREELTLRDILTAESDMHLYHSPSFLMEPFTLS